MHHDTPITSSKRTSLNVYEADIFNCFRHPVDSPTHSGEAGKTPVSLSRPNFATAPRTPLTNRGPMCSNTTPLRASSAL